MFIDYLTLPLTNLAAGFTVLALFLGSWFDKNPKKAVPGFLLTGLIALVGGFAIVLTRPLQGVYNI